MGRRRRIALVVAAAAITACGGSDGSGSADDTADRLPDLELVSLDESTTISLADIDGPAVINLWATWCAPCRREIPDFEAVHRARGDEVRFVGVNVGEDAAPASEFIAEVGATYEQWLDPEGLVVTELRTTAMPVTFVLDAEGRVSTRHLGPMDVDDLDEAIDAALAAVDG